MLWNNYDIVWLQLVAINDQFSVKHKQFLIFKIRSLKFSASAGYKITTISHWPFSDHFHHLVIVLTWIILNFIMGSFNTQPSLSLCVHTHVCVHGRTHKQMYTRTYVCTHWYHTCTHYTKHYTFHTIHIQYIHTLLHMTTLQLPETQ